ncbi:MAG: hypothetical protein RR058_04795 [Oscillospiraceae bacterium]
MRDVLLSLFYSCLGLLFFYAVKHANDKRKEWRELKAEIEEEERRKNSAEESQDELRRIQVEDLQSKIDAHYSEHENSDDPPSDKADIYRS